MRHRGAKRRLHVGAALQLLAEPADDEQRVVNAQCQPQPGDEVDGVDGDVCEQREGQEATEAEKDRGHAHKDGQARRDEPAEDEQQQHEGDRDGDHLGHHEVRSDALPEGGPGHRGATHQHLHPVGRAREAITQGTRRRLGVGGVGHQAHEYQAGITGGIDQRPATRPGPRRLHRGHALHR